MCDGIPQCDDNSDESPENCPSKKNRAKQSLSNELSKTESAVLNFWNHHEIWQLKLPISCSIVAKLLHSSTIRGEALETDEIESFVVKLFRVAVSFMDGGW